MIHDSLEESYNLLVTFRNDENEVVTSLIIEVVRDETDEWDRSTIRRACQRFFEGRKRSSKLQQNPEKEKAFQVSKKLRSRRNRLFRKRQKGMKGEEERAIFLKLTPDYMSDEHSDEEFMVRRSPAWRDAYVGEILHGIDRRTQQTRVKEGLVFYQERKRRDGPVSLRPPPAHLIDFVSDSHPVETASSSPNRVLEHSTQVRQSITPHSNRHSPVIDTESSDTDSEPSTPQRPVQDSNRGRAMAMRRLLQARQAAKLKRLSKIRA